MAQRTVSQSGPHIARDILLATCRADPTTRRQHDDVPLPAGEYRLLLASPRSSGSCAERRRAHRAGCCTAEDHHRTATPAPELPAGDVLLVVHGFNCTALDGVETACNVRDALAAHGLPLTDPAAAPGRPPAPGALAVIGFTWPCQHTMVPGYMADKAAVARFGAFSLANLLTDLRRNEPGRRIHVLAHSMGCFLTLKALNMLAVLHASDIPLPVVNHLMWFAPDVNADALERSTPDEPNLPGWRSLTRHPRLFRPLRYAGHDLLRPRPVEDTSAPAPMEDEPASPPSSPDLHTTSSRQPTARRRTSNAHPLDGYGYDALDAVEGLRAYSSLYDEALVVSPWANRTTEESTAASGAIRFGWCGPLHPQMALAPAGAAHPHTLTLVECSDVAHEHGDYFFSPVVQRDLAAHLSAAQAMSIPIAPPPERVPLAAWHAGAPLQYPPKHGKPAAPTHYAGSLTLLKLNANPHPVWPEGAPRPCPGGTLARFGLAIWHGPLGQLWVRLSRWYYRV